MMPTIFILFFSVILCKAIWNQQNENVSSRTIAMMTLLHVAVRKFYLNLV
jgi:hypothetical protein